MEKVPKIEIYIKFNMKGILGGWKSIYEFRSLIERKELNLKDPLLSKVSFGVNPLRGGGYLSGLEFVNLENSKSKILKFSKNAPKWRKVCEGLNLFGKCIYGYCKAFNNEVIFPVGINVKFDLNKQKKKLYAQFAIKILFL